VGWFDGVLKETHKCKTLKAWIDGWRDGSKWKKNYIIKNPGNVYVEIENYYVKAFSGWKDGPVGEREYEMAKAALERFDVVFVTEWMDEKNQIDAMNSIFSINQKSQIRRDVGHQVKGDNTARKRLTEKLASNESEMEQILMDINVYDIRLWKYAQKLLSERLKLTKTIVKDMNGNKNNGMSGKKLNLKNKIDYEKNEKINKVRDKECGIFQPMYVQKLNPLLSTEIGIFQPPGHKGPF
jgi:hypothetical protein